MNAEDTRAVREFGRKLHRVLCSKCGFAILDGWQCGWTDGGCLVLANALRRWLGEGEIVSVWEDLVYDNRSPDHVQHHTILSINGWVVDGDGVAERNKFLELWREREGVGIVRYGVFDPDVAWEQGLASRPELEEEVERLLDSKFGVAKVRTALTA